MYLLTKMNRRVRGVPENLKAIKTLKKNLKIFSNTYSYICQRAFSVMNFERCKFCSRLTGEYLHLTLHTSFFFSFKSHAHRSRSETPNIRSLKEGYHVMTL